MGYYNYNEEIRVIVDVSFVGLGVIFIQEDKVVVYVSCLLSVLELCYSQIEREVLVIVLVCEYFDMYLRGVLYF